jgi:hypothetical protein
MKYPTHDTEWATSPKGNLWKKTNGIALIVGEKKNGRYWARRGQDFLKGDFGSEREAMLAAERGADGDESNFEDDDAFWGSR